MITRVKPGRAYRESELYSKKYYAQKIQPLVRRELDLQQPTDATSRLKIVRQCTLEAYEKEPSEVREEIMREVQQLKMQVKENNEADDAPTPEDLRA